jgi:hypothetical protein
MVLQNSNKLKELAMIKRLVFILVVLAFNGFAQEFDYWTQVTEVEGYICNRLGTFTVIKFEKSNMVAEGGTVGFQFVRSTFGAGTKDEIVFPSKIEVQTTKGENFIDVLHKLRSEISKQNNFPYKVELGKNVTFVFKEFSDGDIGFYSTDQGIPAVPPLNKLKLSTNANNEILVEWEKPADIIYDRVVVIRDSISLVNFEQNETRWIDKAIQF